MKQINYQDVVLVLQKIKSPKKAGIAKSFFKAGKGQYAEGDVFLGVSVPDCRKVACRFENLALPQVKKLISHKFHEVRQVGFFILVSQFQKGTKLMQKRVYDFYMRSLVWCNNWDLVDLSAYKVAGSFLLHRDKTVLYKLAVSKSIWKRRVAIVSTYIFIKHGIYADTLRLAVLLQNDKEDLIHKAVGWMLREVGKKDVLTLKNFLDTYRSSLPRTTLRYAIERLSPEEKIHYIQK